MGTLTAEEIARLLLFVAPGYFAIRAYQYRFPRRRRDAFELFVLSLVWSVPLVALAEPLRRAADIPRDALSWRYIVPLLLISALIGYLLALIRGVAWVRKGLLRIGSGVDPESSVLIRAASNLARSNSLVTVTLRDGDVISGCPRWWTDDPESELRELYLTHSAWWDEKAGDTGGDWQARREQGGVLLNLADVQAVEFEDDPR